MKIAFIGSHGIGKSQIIKEIKKHYPEITFIEDIAQKTISKVGKKPTDMDYEEKNDFQLTVFMNQLRKEILYSDFVSDRTVLDAVVYSKGLHVRSFLKEVAKVYLKKYNYDKIYFVRKEFVTSDQAGNSEFEEYQDFIQIELLKLLEELKIDYEELVGSPYERTRKVLSYVKNNLH